MQATSAFRTRLLGRSVLQISGSDSSKFLQGLLSQSVPEAPYEGRYTALLNAKGRVLSDAFVTLAPGTGDEAYWMDVPAGMKDYILAHLKKYKLRSKVKLVDVSDNVHVHAFVAGDPNVRSANRLLQELAMDRNIEEGLAVFNDPRMGCLGSRMMLPEQYSAALNAADSALGYALVEEALGRYDAWRLLKGVPDLNQDIQPEKSLPLESNLHWLNAISFEKGCYVGQELTARTYHRGATRKRLVPLYLCSETDVPSTLLHDPMFPRFSPVLESNLDDQIRNATADREIRMGDKKVGTLFSTRFNLGMGLLRLDPLFSPTAPLICGNLRVFPFVPSWWQEGQ